MNGTADKVVAIVGRPNVGKSSLFNRLVGSGRALVHPEAGTTRDRIEARCLLGESRGARLVDTGGILPKDEEALYGQVRAQVMRAVRESDMLLFVVDVQTGLVPLDEPVADLLRKSAKPVLLVANKADNPALSDGAVDFYPLGFGDPFPVSCTQGTGIRALRGHLSRLLESPSSQGSAGPAEVPGEETAPIRIAVVGRPNVGKSSFLNKLLNDERLIVDGAPGTTRDPVDIPFSHRGGHYLLMDTAGIRRFSKIRDAILFQSVQTTRRMIQKSDVCLLLLDGATGVQGEDLQILRWVAEEGRGVVLLVNKWDLVKDVPEKQAERFLRRRLGELNFMPVLFTSAATGRNVLKALDAAKAVTGSCAARVGTSTLNAFLSRIRKAPGLFPGRRAPHLSYLVQTGSRPTRFLFFGVSGKNVSPALSRFLERKLREHFPLSGTPIRLSFREGGRKR